MKKTKLLVSVGALALICSVASCGHEHEFASEWSKDATNHWHAALCEHAEEVADLAAHTWNEGVVTLEPTEEAEGTKTYTCTVCEQTKTETIPQLAHTHKYETEWSKDETHHWYASACGHAEEISGKAEHTWDAGTVSLEPTEEAEGTRTFACTVCGQTKTESIDKLPHTHKFASEWTDDETHHWHASTCEHTEEVDAKAEHTWTEVSSSTVDGITTTLNKCSVCERPNEVVVDNRVYTSENWAPTGAEKAYYFDGEKIISVNEEDIKDGGKHFDYDAHDYLLNNTAVGANYVVSLQARGTYPANVDVEMDAGLVAWYVDADNFIIFGTKWANWDRPSEIRSLFIAGKVNGKEYAADIWTDSCGIAPADGVSIQVTKAGTKFDYVLKGIDFIYEKKGSVNIAGTDTESAKVGIYGANDKVTFEKFSAENFTPAATVSYAATIDGVANTLVLNTDEKTFVLKAGSDEKSGTYVADGRNITLTYSDTTVAYVKVYDTNGKFEFYTPVVQDEVDVTLEGQDTKVSYTVVDSMTGDYTLSFDYLGTKTAPGSAVKLGVNAWYVDENNYLDFYIEWSAGDRPHEIRCVQLTGYIGGNHVGWNDLWCDGSNVLVGDGGTFTVTKTGNTFAVKLVAGSFVKEGSKTFDGIDTALAYGTKLYAEGDNIAISNLSQTLGSLYTVSGEGAATAKVATDEIVLNNAKAVRNEKVTGDYTYSFDLLGTKTSAGSAVKFGFMPWYVDENNYLDFYVEWSAGDRPHEIRCVQLTGYINGSHVGWHDVWCDGSNVLSGDGVNLTVVKTGKTFAVKLVAGSFVKEGSKTFDVIDEALEYSYGFYSEGDQMTVSNFEVESPEVAVEPTTVASSMADVATANSWVNATLYDSFALDANVTVSATGTPVGSYGLNTGKYYENGNNWRIYQNENPQVTVSVAEGYELVSVKVTYSVSNTGVLTLDGVNIESDQVVEASGSSIVFSVGNTGTKTNGQARITNIEVVYVAK